MNTLTLSYSAHRPETLSLAARLMQEHDMVILEEPPHYEFQAMLAGQVTLEAYLLQLDLGYPEFARLQYRLLQQLARSGKKIMQVEPYLNSLLEIQASFARNHSPGELDRSTEQYAVYSREREATGPLLAYYRAVRAGDFEAILSAVKAFAAADAARFRLRDALRAGKILTVLPAGGSVYVEAGTVHLLLHKYLRAGLLSQDWRLQVRFLEKDAMRLLGISGTIFSPGDELTIAHMFKKQMGAQREDLLAAQALMYAKLIRKDEIRASDSAFPHTRAEVETIGLVRQLAFVDCETLFFRIRSMPPQQAMEEVQRYLEIGGET